MKIGKDLQFPIETYSSHGFNSTQDPRAQTDANSRLLSSHVCLPSKESDYRRYIVRNNNEGYVYAQQGTMDSYSLGAVACPAILKCNNCPLRK